MCCLATPTVLAMEGAWHARTTLVFTALSLTVGLATTQPATIAEVTGRANETLQGLFRYYWAHDTYYKAVGFFFACGQVGGMGNGGNPWSQCLCYNQQACVNCYRWWDAVALESIANYGIYTKTKQYAQIADVIFAHSPYNAKWDASVYCTFVDDFTWYGIAYLRVYDWLKVRDCL